MINVKYKEIGNADVAADLFLKKDLFREAIYRRP